MMNGHHLPSRTKRKELHDSTGDFSISPPARKTRRVEAQVLPIIEEPDDDAPLDSQFDNLSSCDLYADGLRIKELPNDEDVEMGASVVHSHSALDNELWSSQSNSWRPPSDGGMGKEDSNSGGSNRCLAVVPWVPLKIPSVASGADCVSPDEGRMMEETEEVAMDTDENMSYDERSVSGNGVASLSEGLHQWQQQQCMPPQPPYGTSTPLFGYQ